MLAPNLDRVRKLLFAALELPPEDRGAFVDRETAGDATVRAELIELLTLDPMAEGFLEQSLPASLGLGQTTRPPLTGARLDDRYDLELVMAESGFATVYLARDTAVARKRVVVKVLDRVAQSEIARQSFQVELEALTAIDHPAVVGVSDTGITPDGFPYLVLAYVPGVSLRDLLAAGPLSRDRSIALLKGLARALAIAHRAGVAHLDVKPENIIISDPGTPDERATLLDFGISRLRSADDGIQAGSRSYMAPEQMTSPSASCDVYALGRIAKEMGALPPTLDRRFPSAVEFAIALDQATRPRPWRWVVPAAAILAAIAIGIDLNQPPSHFYAPSVPLVTTAGYDQQPALSADGQWIYFAIGPINHGDIFRQSTTGGQPVPLVIRETNDTKPQPTPDGKAFSFLRADLVDDHAIMLQDLAPGSTPKVLFRATAIGYHCWSPNGRYLIFSQSRSVGQSKGLSRFDLATKELHQIYPPLPEIAFDLPAISPDGSRLAFIRRVGRAADAYVVAISPQGLPLGIPRQITTIGERIQGLQWTPDSRDLVVLSGAFESSVLRRVSASGGQAIRINNISERVNAITVAAHTWKLAYGIDLTDANVWRLNLTQKGPEASQQVINGTGEDEEASPSPDGRSIVFTSSRTGRQQIWLADHDGKNLRQVTNLEGHDAVEAGWTPDGRDLLITIHSPRGNNLFRTPSAGPYVLNHIVEDAHYLSFAPDGRSFFIARYPSNIGEIWRIPYPALNPAVRLPLPGGRFVSESPDGQQLFYSHRHEKEGLFSQPMNQSTPAPLRVIKHLQHRTFFVAGTQGIFYIAPRVGQKSGLYFLRYGSQASVLLHRFEHLIGSGFKLSTDEKSLLFTQIDSDNNDIQLIPSFR